MSSHQQLEVFIPDQIWTATAPFRFFGIQIGIRMTVVRLANKDLWVHSPIPLTEALKSQLNALGSVAYVVSPNCMHHLYLNDYVAGFPLARVYASPGLPEKRKDLTFRHVLTANPEQSWFYDLDQFLLVGFENLREIVFYHRQCQTLIVADLLMNLINIKDPLSKFAAKSMGIYGKATPAADLKLSEVERGQAKLSIKRILDWNFDKIVLSHGELITANGKEILQQAFEPILGS